MILLILYSESTAEVEEKRMLMGFLMLFVNYIFYILFFINIIALIISTVKDFCKKRKKKKEREEIIQSRTQPPIPM